MKEYGLDTTKPSLSTNLKLALAALSISPLIWNVNVLVPVKLLFLGVNVTVPSPTFTFSPYVNVKFLATSIFFPSKVRSISSAATSREYPVYSLVPITPFNLVASAD